MSSPRIAIIYLSYNSRPYLDAVASSIEELRYPKECLEWVIVDNHSPDNSAEAIRESILPRAGKTLPRVRFFANEENSGFAAGNNIAIAYALEQGFDYIYLLNNDARFHPDALSEAVRLAESNAHIGSIQSLMCLWQDERVVNSTGGMVHFLGFGFVRDNGRNLSDVARRDGEEIAYASGAAVMYRAEVLRQVGLLDPYLFLYHEDLELGWRIRLAGYENVLSMRSVVFHHYEFRRSIQKFFWMERNRVLVHASLLKWRTLFLLFPWMVALELALIFFAMKGGWAREKLRVYREFFRLSTWKYVWKKRRTVRSVRQVKDREIVRLFTGMIAHQETTSVLVDRFGNPILHLVWMVLRSLIRW